MCGFGLELIFLVRTFGAAWFDKLKHGRPHILFQPLHACQVRFSCEQQRTAPGATSGCEDAIRGALTLT